jgi:hypothetical protein
VKGPLRVLVFFYVKEQGRQLGEGYHLKVWKGLKPIYRKEEEMTLVLACWFRCKTTKFRFGSGP